MSDTFLIDLLLLKIHFQLQLQHRGISKHYQNTRYFYVATSQNPRHANSAEVVNEAVLLLPVHLSYFLTIGEGDGVWE
jgi:hypothetical protein